MSGHPFHPGELMAQRRFDPDWDEAGARRLGRIIQSALTDEMALFIEGRPFFFLATADAQGHCDCSFKGTDPATEDRLVPAARVVAPQRLVFPDYPGNRLFNSLGNILVNPQVGLLFIDFAGQARLRVNGAARLLDEVGDWRAQWPEAARVIEVTVEQVYWNCPKRIPVQP